MNKLEAAQSVGKEVTWGTGVIRGKLLSSSTMERCGEQCVQVQLTRDYTTPCGKRVMKGTIVSAPLMELVLL